MCNFESGLCGVMFDPTANFNWTRVSGFDTSNVLYTGPISGQGGSRWYLLLDSRARDANHEARYISVSSPFHFYRVLHRAVHHVSKNCAKLFLSELRQILTNFDNFWQEDGKEAKIMRSALIFHFTNFASSHYHVKRRCSKLLAYTTLEVIICNKLSNDLISTQ